jgi:hypothetical protein
MKNLKSFLFVTTLLTVQMINFPTYAQKKDSVIPSQKEAIALMQGICGEGNVTVENGNVSCQTCPSYTVYGTGGSGGSGGTLGSVIYGSFTKPGIREALVDFGGCEPHSGNYGGSALLRRNNNGWFRVRYEEGFRSNICQKLKTNSGRDFVVCKGNYDNYGLGYEWIELVKFNIDKITQTPILNVDSRWGSSCRPPYHEVEIKNFTLRNINQDKLPDLIVTVRTAKDNIKRKVDNSGCPSSMLGKSKIHQLTFLFNGQSFYPTKATAKIIRNFPKTRG